MVKCLRVGVAADKIKMFKDAVVVYVMQYHSYCVDSLMGTHKLNTGFLTFLRFL
jgi:hypothetical protein